MKRVIDGQTYNTDTATRIAVYAYDDDKGYEVEATVYQTRGGAFFIVHKTDPGKDEQYKFQFEAISREEIDRLIARGGEIEIIDASVLAEPPEAASEEEPGATIYVRVPAPLKRRVDAAASTSNLSGNAWAMRCMERCLDEPDVEPVARIFGLAATARVGRDIEWERDTFLDALEMIADWAEQAGKSLVGEAFDNVVASVLETADIDKKFAPYA